MELRPRTFILCVLFRMPKQLMQVRKNLISPRAFLIDVSSSSAAQEGKRLVVIGSSFISMEIVVAVAKRKLASIDVIGMEKYPFEAVLGEEVGKGLKAVGFFFLSRGRKVHCMLIISSFCIVS
jgi:hypothetical protein